MRPGCSGALSALHNAFLGFAPLATTAPRACYAAIAKSEVLSLIKDLRAQSGAPMGDVKKALEEADYDVDKAFEVLRKKGIAAAAKKASRSAVQVEEAVKAVAGKVRENIVLRRASLLSSPGYIASYIHNAVSKDTGLVAAAVSFEATDVPASALKESSELKEFGKHVAMQMLEKEREIQMEVARKEGKPEKIIERMVDGRLGKFYEEHVLLEQKFILDDKITVQKAMAAVGKSIGCDLSITKFVRLKVGEGLEAAPQQG